MAILSVETLLRKLNINHHTKYTIAIEDREQLILFNCDTVSFMTEIMVLSSFLWTFGQDHEKKMAS